MFSILLHNGGCAGSDRSELRHRTECEGEIEVTCENERGRHQEGNGLEIPDFMGALLDILPRCVDMKERNGEITKGTYSDQLTEVVGEGAFDEEGLMSTQFLRSTRVGPCPGEMQTAWDVLRSEAATNYGLLEGFREEEARERKGPLAKQTSAGVRNIGAAKMKKTRRVEAFVAEGSMRTADMAREQGERREEGDARQRQQVGEASSENMDELMEAVAEAISQAEREAAEAQDEPKADANGA